MTTEPHDPIGAALSGGRYVITSKLGEGGMGAVYRAEDHNLSADVVIKLPHRSMVTDAEFSRRFRDEVRSLVRLSHPHIVKVTDVGEWVGVPFAVLQFLPGGSLEDRLAAWRGPAALAAFGGWVGPVGGALDYVHSQKMVHRDVKPGNILFDAQGHPFLGDFGVVKVLAAAADGRAARTAMTGTGMVLGTPHYMAPELIMGDPFDGRVDQYALAVTAYELLCGRRPFEHDVPTRVLMMQAGEAPPAPTALCPWVPARVEAALLRGLAKDPADRYPSCAAFAADLVDAAGGGRAGQAGRARLRCSSCAKVLSVSVESLAKLSRSGRTEPCPNCRAPLDLTAGTAVVLPPAPSGEMARGDSTILRVGNGTGELKTAALADPAPPRGSGTVAVGAVRPAAPAAPAVSGIKETTAAEAPPGPGPVAAVVAGPVRPKPPWVAIGLGSAAAAVIAGAAVSWAIGPRRSPAPGTTAVVANQDSTALDRSRGVPGALVVRNAASTRGMTYGAGSRIENRPSLQTPHSGFGGSGPPGAQKSQGRAIQGWSRPPSPGTGYPRPEPERLRFPTLTAEDLSESKRPFPLPDGATTARIQNPRPGDKSILGGLGNEAIPVVSNISTFPELDKAVDAGDETGMSNLVAEGKVRLVQVNTPILVIKALPGAQAVEVRITGGYIKGSAVYVKQSTCYRIVTKEESERVREARVAWDRQQEEKRKQEQIRADEVRAARERQQEENRKQGEIRTENLAVAAEYKAEWKKVEKAALGMGIDHAVTYKRESRQRILSKILSRHPGFSEARLRSAIR